jgi:toxin CptA
MGLRGLLRPANAYRLDISGIGQMRLAVYLQSERGQAVAPPGAVALMADSALWPWLLVLRLRCLDEQGSTLCLLVLPDSVAPGVFRPLALACRACAAKIVY